ncbi:hypothetical protein PSCICG_00480 [Pseudomonas cichorii]|nr:hypothetical protein PSCICG_00480 [Pseudomonas cichorii]
MYCYLLVCILLSGRASSPDRATDDVYGIYGARRFYGLRSHGSAVWPIIKQRLTGSISLDDSMMQS